MNIDSIQNGVVIDHIAPGRGMEIVRLLGLEKLDCPIAVIRNARSNKSGKKDIIKIEDGIDIDFNVLGFIDPHITVNIIENNHIVDKKQMLPPHTVVDVVECKNPRCITSTERGLSHIFRREEDEEIYRCAYCEQEYQHYEP